MVTQTHTHIYRADCSTWTTTVVGNINKCNNNDDDDNDNGKFIYRVFQRTTNMMCMLEGRDKESFEVALKIGKERIMTGNDL